MNPEALFDRAEKKAEEYEQALLLAVNAKAQPNDTLQLVAAAEGNAIFVMAQANEGQIPGKNDMQRKQAIQRTVTTDPAYISATKAAKTAEVAYLIIEARAKAMYQQLQVLMAGLNNLLPDPFDIPGFNIGQGT